MSIDGRPESAGHMPCDALTETLRAQARAAAIADAALLDAVVTVADRDPAGFEADLVAFTLAWTQTNARAQVELGRYLQRVVKPVWTACCMGDLDMPRARVFHDVLAAVDDDVAFTIALDLVDRAAGWTTSQLRERLRRAVLRADPDGSAKRAARTVADRRVSLAPESHGTAGLYANCLPAARAVAAYERVDAYARARRANGDARTLDQLRADTVLDLLEGVAMTQPPAHRRGVVEISIPWAALAGSMNPPCIAPASVDSTRLAPAVGLGGSAACAGSDSFAGTIRDRALDAGGTSETARQDAARACGAPAGGGEPATLAGFGPIDALTACRVVESMFKRGDITWRYRIDDPRGRLLHIGPLPTPHHRAGLANALTSIATAAAHGQPQPPQEADPRRRSPGRALSRWIQARDGTCRAPGCRTPASVCDIDHTVAYADGGRTTHDNLALTCRHHHRLKHETGWQVTQRSAGALLWQSPHGDQFTSSHTS